MPALAQLQRVNALLRPSWRAVSATLQSRDNRVRNGALSGATVGVIGSGGAYPTNTGSSSAGLTVTVAEIGAENGIDYVSLRYNGVTNTTFFVLNLETTTQIAALTGQTWTESAFLRLISGNFTNITGVTLTINEQTSGGAFVTNGSSSALSITSVFTRFSFTRTLSGGGTTAFAQPNVVFSCNNASAVDFTLRVGLPMLHPGSVALSPLRTSTAARTGVHFSNTARV